MFMPDLNRNVYFTYEQTNDTYANLDTFVYSLDDAVLANSTENANYDIEVAGTSNLTTSLNAWSFAAKGHYYGLSDEASSAKPDIVLSDGVEVVANAVADDTFIGVESMTGVTLILKERLFFNMVVYGDDLF